MGGQNYEFHEAFGGAQLGQGFNPNRPFDYGPLDLATGDAQKSADRVARSKTEVKLCTTEESLLSWFEIDASAEFSYKLVTGKASAHFDRVKEIKRNTLFLVFRHVIEFVPRGIKSTKFTPKNTWTHYISSITEGAMAFVVYRLRFSSEEEALSFSASVSGGTSGGNSGAISLSGGQVTKAIQRAESWTVETFGGDSRGFAADVTRAKGDPDEITKALASFVSTVRNVATSTEPANTTVLRFDISGPTLPTAGTRALLRIYDEVVTYQLFREETIDSRLWEAVDLYIEGWEELAGEIAAGKEKATLRKFRSTRVELTKEIAEDAKNDPTLKPLPSRADIEARPIIAMSGSVTGSGPVNINPSWYVGRCPKGAAWPPKKSDNWNIWGTTHQDITGLQGPTWDHRMSVEGLEQITSLTVEGLGGAPYFAKSVLTFWPLERTDWASSSEYCTFLAISNVERDEPDSVTNNAGRMSFRTFGCQNRHLVCKDRLGRVFRKQLTT